MEKMKVGVVGATGMVGQRFLTLLEDHPYFEVTALVASKRSAGKTYEEALGGRWVMKTELPEKVRNMVVLDATADKERVSAGYGRIVSVSKSCKDIKLITREHRAHLLSSAADYLIDNRELPLRTVTHGNGSAQKESFKLDINELTGSCYVTRIARECHTEDRVRQGDVFFYFKNALLHYLPHASIVEIRRVVSSRTSSKTFTVSRDVNIVTLLSVAQRRIW